MKIVFTPDWFLGSDVLIEIFSFIILVLFFYFSVRAYKINKKKNSLYLGTAFLLIAVAELATIFTKLILYYDTTFTQNIGRVVVTYSIVKSVDVFYYIGFFFHKFLTLFGFYLIYRIPLEKKSSEDFMLAVYFIILSAFFSQGVYALFHLTALVLLILIANNYYKIYKKNRLPNTKILVIVFSILAFSQILLLMSQVEFIYALAQVLQLVSYLILLVLIIRIIKYGTKKKSSKHNIRYVRNNPRKKRRD